MSGTKTRVWRVFQAVGLYKTRSGEEGVITEEQGIFSSEDAARRACLNWRYGYHSFELDSLLPDHCCQMVPVVYPIKLVEDKEYAPLPKYSQGEGAIKEENDRLRAGLDAVRNVVGKLYAQIAEVK